MGVGYRYALEHEANGWWLVRFPDIPEALTEGETEAEARGSALDCLLAALDGYVKQGRTIPRPSPQEPGQSRVTLPSLATAKLALHETMRMAEFSASDLAHRLGMTEASLRRLLDLRQHSDIRTIDLALKAMGAELPMRLPEARPGDRKLIPV